MLTTEFRKKSSGQKHYPGGSPALTVPALHTRSISESNQSWLHIHLFQFSLDILTRGNSDRRACVLVEGKGKRLQIALADAHAASLGVRIGMPLGAAQILGDLTVLSRNERAERQAIETPPAPRAADPVAAPAPAVDRSQTVYRFSNDGVRTGLLKPRTS